jgi:hypothetical protein
MLKKYLKNKVFIYFFCSQVIELLMNVTLISIFKNLNKKDLNFIHLFESNLTSLEINSIWIEKNKFFMIKNVPIVFLSLTSNYFPQFLSFNSKSIQNQNQSIRLINFFNETGIILLYKNFIIYNLYFDSFEMIFFTCNFIIAKFILLIIFFYYVFFEFNFIYIE